MNYKQVQWAMQHDWFISAYEWEPGHWVVVVDDTVWDCYEGVEIRGQMDIGNFQHLRDWAGY